MTLPEGSLLNPKFPAPLSNRLNVHTRLFDCMSGALGQNAPDLSMAAGYGTSPFFVFSGYTTDDEYFQFVELLFGGAARRLGATGSTATRGGRCSARRRPSTSRATTRCWSNATCR